MTASETRLGLPVLHFAGAAAFDAWLADAPCASAGIWLRLAKKGSDLPSVAKAAAIDAALCHGWIDGQQHPYDDRCWLTRFTPRRPASRWSQVNRARALELIAAGRMQAAGMAEIEAARADGRWDAAYAPARTAEPSAELRAALEDSTRAAAAFAALSRTERYAILHGLANLKTPAGRARRITACISALAASDAGRLPRQKRALALTP